MFTKTMSARGGTAFGGKKLVLLSVCLLLLSGCGTAIKTSKDKGVNQNLNQAQTETAAEAKKIVDLKETIDAMGHENLLENYNQAIIKTNMGDITVEFYNEDSPLTVNNFLNLADQSFYDETKFHRVIKGFMIQAGDPLSRDDNSADDGTGGPGYRFNDEFNDNKLVKGSLAMANSGPNTNGSQFFIVTVASTPWLDGLHTNFGKVIEGMDIVTAIEGSKTGARDYPVEPIIIESIELIAK
jgi:peptidyl-prolyl cis-trans isomerase B (cyclophilin B)